MGGVHSERTFWIRPISAQKGGGGDLPFHFFLQKSSFPADFDKHANFTIFKQKKIG